MLLLGRQGPKVVSSQGIPGRRVRVAEVYRQEAGKSLLLIYYFINLHTIKLGLANSKTTDKETGQGAYHTSCQIEDLQAQKIAHEQVSI